MTHTIATAAAPGYVAPLYGPDRAEVGLVAYRAWLLESGYAAAFLTPLPEGVRTDARPVQTSDGIVWTDPATGHADYPHSAGTLMGCPACEMRPCAHAPGEGGGWCVARSCPDEAPEPCPATGVVDCRSRDCELHYMSAPLRLAP